jgi:aspartate racemase
LLDNFTNADSGASPGFRRAGKGTDALRKLGIIGGTTWSSTALYYEHINRGVAQRLGGLHSARVTVESIDFADLVALENADDWDGVAELNCDAAKRLEAAGADGVLMACNTTHKVFGAVAASINIPMLHIADAAADRIVADRRTLIALLGTRFTMTESYIRERLEARGIGIAPIDRNWVNEIDRIIFEELSFGRVVRDSQRKLKTLVTDLAKQKVQAVVLACTELVLAVDVRANVIPVYDTTAIHARAAVDWMLAEEEEARAAA